MSLRSLVPSACLAIAFVALAITPARAEMFQCLKDGRRSFQQLPCADGAQTAAPAGRAVARASAPAWPWTGLAAGMTVAQVQAAQPGAMPGKGARLVTGATGALGRELVIEGTPFAAEWYFDAEGRYRQVNVNSKDMQIANARVQQLVAAIEPRLTALFGAPTKRDLERRPTGLFGGMEWALPGGGRAWLSASPITADTASVLMGVRPGAAP